MKKTTLFILLCFISSSTFAAHIIGSVLYYEVTKINANGTSTVRINMDIYRDASSGGANFDADADFGVYEKMNNDVYTYILSKMIIPINRIDIYNVNVNSDCNNTSNVIVERATYSFEVDLDLNKVHTIAYQRCCKASQILNLVEPDKNGSAVFLNLTKESISYVHKGPRPNGFFERILTVNQSNEVDFSFTSENELNFTFSKVFRSGGIDGESGVYCIGVRPESAKCLPPFATNDFLPGFSYDKPFGNLGTTALDSEIGLIKVDPTAIGFYTMELLLTETKDGVLMSEANLNWTFSVISNDNKFATGLRFFDVNKNGIYDGQDKISDLLFNYNGALCGSSFKNESGEYQFFPFKAEIGSISSIDPNWTIVSDSIYDFTSSNSIERDVIFSPTNKNAKANLDVTQSRIRCNEEFDVDIKVSNIGIEKLAANMTIDYDPSLMFFSSSYPNYVVDEIKHQLIINLEAINVYDDFSCTLVFKAGSASDVHRILDNTYQLGYKIYASTDDETKIRIEKNESVGCALDPNNKLVSPEVSFNKADKFTYTINFENIGNSYANKIIVKDTIAQEFDFKSIRVLGASHGNLTILLAPENRVLSFIFENINLLPKDKGFVRFEIATNSWEANKILFNKASIYFDQNAPIQTNTSKLLLTTKEAVGNTSSEISFSPNPVVRYLNFNYDEIKNKIYSCDIFDLTGRKIKHYPSIPQNRLDLIDLAPNIYFIKLYYNFNETKVFKFVKI